MKYIIHSADLHLDYKNKQIQKTTEDNRNIREYDFFKAFEEVVDIVIEKKPAAFVIAGDLCDIPRISNIVLKSIINLLNRLEEAGIETIIQAGNHDTPQLRVTTSSFESLMEIDYKHIRFVYHSIERIKIDDMEFIVVPHLSIADGFNPKDLEPDYENNKYSVLVLHGVADGSDIFKQVDESREMPLGAHILNMGHTYIALGHYHKRSKVRKNAWYAGSLENGSFGPDVQKEKGALLVNLDEIGKGDYSPELLKVNIRRIVDFGVYDAFEKTSEEIEEEVKSIIEKQDITDALSRMKIININKTTYDIVDKKLLKSYGAAALYFNINWAISQIEKTSSSAQKSENDKIQDLETEWTLAVEERYINEDKNLPEKAKVIEKGKEYIKNLGSVIDDSEN